MVELINVSFRYGTEDTQAGAGNSLTDISLTVQTGEFILLTGPSGCGKTTVMLPHVNCGN